MAKERLQPSLLDRLTDYEPGQRFESLERRVLSPQQLRECVRRDLAWLLNAPNFASVHDLSEFPEVARSVVNFGVTDFIGKVASSFDTASLAKDFRRALLDFEPRLMPGTVQVHPTTDPQNRNPNALCFSIEAELWSQPVPLRLRLRTDLNLEDGEARVSEMDSE